MSNKIQIKYKFTPNKNLLIFSFSCLFLTACDLFHPTVNCNTCNKTEASDPDKPFNDAIFLRLSQIINDPYSLESNVAYKQEDALTKIARTTVNIKRPQQREIKQYELLLTLNRFGEKWRVTQETSPHLLTEKGTAKVTAFSSIEVSNTDKTPDCSGLKNYKKLDILTGSSQLCIFVHANEPGSLDIKLQNKTDSDDYMGYSNDWESFTPGDWILTRQFPPNKYYKKGQYIYKVSQYGHVIYEYAFNYLPSKQFDENGNQIEGINYSLKGEPILLDGVHRWTAKYDEKNNQIERNNFGLKDEPVLVDGVHKWTAKYDYDDNKIEKAKYDDKGNQIEEAYFDLNSKPIVSTNGVHKWTAKYDDKNNLIDKNYFDVTENQVNTKMVVVSVDPNSQGEQLGLKAGDIFTHYDGQAVKNSSIFIANREKEAADSPPKELTVLRNGNTIKYTVKPGKIGAGTEDKVQ